MTKCQHTKTRAVYEQRSPSAGRKLLAVVDRCEGCGALLPRAKQEADQ